MKIKFNNLYLQNKIFLKEFTNSFKKLVKNSSFIGGKEIVSFENNFRKKFKSRYCISVANGTDALIIALKCLGIKYNDEVIVPAHTWVSTAGAVVAVGAKPKFVDCDEFFTIDVSKIESKISKKTKAIIPVHLYGQPCDMDKILKISKKYKLKIIEDCAQAHLTKYNGKIVGNFGHVGTFSFFPGKNMGAMGDAGAIICNNKKLFYDIKKYRNHGSLKKNEHETFGINSRLDTLQAIILNKKISYLQKQNNQRKKIALLYKKYLNKNSNIILPSIRNNSSHTYHQFVIKVKKDRKKFTNYLKKKGIDTNIHYPKMLISLKPYKKFVGTDNYNYCLNYEKKIVSLPIHPYLSKKQIKYVCGSINEYFD